MKLNKTATQPGKNIDEVAIRAALPGMVQEIGELQMALYAANKNSLLVVLQGMDASGKDGAIKDVFFDVNPMGSHVICFKKPTEHEFSHDFLWRIHANAPPTGMIHIFNRSHYEDILIPSVEGYIPKNIVSKRYQQINDFENMLVENGTSILKFFLNINQDEQKERLKERMTNPKKFWKHKDADWETMKKWDKYMGVYETIFDKCKDVPWHIVPSDKNWYKEYLIAEKVIEALKKNQSEIS
ncbi:MAG: polyphosphate kinase [Bacteroidetes bacterium]|nr:polyphosphate kinase [Bacteroidota bacterium]